MWHESVWSVLIRLGNPTGVFSVPGISAVPLKKYTYNKGTYLRWYHPAEVSSACAAMAYWPAPSSDVNNYSYSPTYETTPQGATADYNQLVFASKISHFSPFHYRSNVFFLWWMGTLRILWHRSSFSWSVTFDPISSLPTECSGCTPAWWLSWLISIWG